MTEKHKLTVAYLRGWADAMITAAGRIEDCVTHDKFYRSPTVRQIEQSLADDGIEL